MQNDLESDVNIYVERENKAKFVCKIQKPPSQHSYETIPKAVGLDVYKARYQIFGI